jgi:uncharacterized RmlC-like cupin family protein
MTTHRPPHDHRDHLESVIHIVKGRKRMRWGWHPEFTAEARSGDFVCVQPEHVLWTLSRKHPRGSALRRGRRTFFANSLIGQLADNRE